MDQREEFKGYVARAVARKAGVALHLATDLVEASSVAAFLAGRQEYVFYKGAEYWAERILNGQ